MSSSSDEEKDRPNGRGGGGAIPCTVDADTLRIMVSTDNHLGYAEKDPVRGMDSFAAFEEVLYLAKRFNCDMVLIAGDLFHENRPTRRTLHKTMEILRRYCMGQDPVKIQILSDPSKTFRNGTINYLDENYSVDLPIFSIHGNHDDPTRDVAGETLAALDLLSVTNLVNYFGRQDLVDKVEVPPVLIQKGATKVAMYGLGSLRDERLNRMWSQGKVRFLRLEQEESDEFCNIFALHQNRDLGRGSKNCVKEDMIPEWMDIVVWGHEHECQIEFQESVTGTFRITQPGSSVATSLVAGEAVPKKVGLLDVKQSNFRLSPIPLTQVRGFVTAELSLKEHRARLDPEDPKIDSKVTDVLEEEVRLLILNARDKAKETLESARRAGSDAGDDKCPVKYRLDKPNEVLVRIRVDHSGFGTLNNQRFGSRFVGSVANPSDILLFSRRKEAGAAANRPSKKSMVLKNALAPEELEQTNMEDLILEHLEAPERKLQILDKLGLSEAMEEYVEKNSLSAIPDAALKMIKKKQKELISRGKNDSGEVIEKGSQIRDLLEAESQAHDRKRPRGTKRGTAHHDEDEEPGKENAPDVDDDDDDLPPPHRRTVHSKSTRSDASHRKAARRERVHESDDDLELDEAPAPTAKGRAASRPRRAQASKKPNYHIDDYGDDDDSDAYEVQPAGSEDDDDLDEDEEEERPKKKTTRKTAASTASRSRNTSPARKAATYHARSTVAASSRTTKQSSRKALMARLDSDDEELGRSRAIDDDMDDDWGTARTRSQY